MSEIDNNMATENSSMQLTIAVDISPNDRDRINILKSTKLALKKLVEERRLPRHADVRIVMCNRWNAQGVTIRNENGAFLDHSEILSHIQKIRGISTKRRRKQSPLGLDGFSEVLERISAGQCYPREVCVFIGNASRFSEEPISEEPISEESAAELMEVAKRKGATVYILDTGEKEIAKQKLLSAVAQASGGLYESPAVNKTFDIAKKLTKIFEDISIINRIANHITDILELEETIPTLNELARRFENCFSTENSELLVTHPTDDLRPLDDARHKLAWCDFSSLENLTEQLSNISIDSQEYHSTDPMERSLVAAVRRWNIQPSDEATEQDNEVQERRRWNIPPNDEAMEQDGEAQEPRLIFAIRRPRPASENVDPTRFLVSYTSDNGGIMFKKV